MNEATTRGVVRLLERIEQDYSDICQSFFEQVPESSEKPVVDFEISKRGKFALVKPNVKVKFVLEEDPERELQVRGFLDQLVGSLKAEITCPVLSHGISRDLLSYRIAVRIFLRRWSNEAAQETDPETDESEILDEAIDPMIFSQVMEMYRNV